jgi:tRNA/tmRNA/rRNA uracil-C5-methylase (TrmA/RlmC/RlmD family)
MKKGQEYTGIIEKTVFPNKGIAHVSDTKVIIKGTLPRQEVRFILSKKRKDKCEGRLLEVIKPSDLEDCSPLCEHFPGCGGCNYQTMSYINQLKMKESQVKELVDSVCSNYEFEGVLGSPEEWNYRNKMEFSFGDEYKGGPLALGLHKKGSFHDIVDIEKCQIVDEDFNKSFMWCGNTF